MNLTQGSAFARAISDFRRAIFCGRDTETHGLCKMAYGLYRKQNGWGDQHSVRVRYILPGPEDEFGPELEVPEKFYTEEGCSCRSTN